MKKILAIATLTILIVALAGCGDSGSDESAKTDADDGVAKKYADILISDDSTYYMKVDVETEMDSSGSSSDASGEEDDSASFEDTQEIAQDDGKKMTSSEENHYIQYYLDNTQYYYDTSEKIYYIMDYDSSDDESTEYTPENGYKETKEEKFDGKKYECDVYETELTSDGDDIISTTKYFVNDDGDLVGVISEQKDKDSERLLSKVTMKVIEFSTTIPDGTFDRPSGYTKAES